MSLYQILQIVGYSVTFAVGAITTIIGFVKAAKNKKLAKSEAEAAEAKQKMLDTASTLIKEAETFYKSLDTVLKNTEGTTAGAYKKESVMTKLKAFAMTIGFNFDEEYWSNKIDEIVKLTKDVNGKN